MTSAVSGVGVAHRLLALARSVCRDRDGVPAGRNTWPRSTRLEPEAHPALAALGNHLRFGQGPHLADLLSVWSRQGPLDCQVAFDGLDAALLVLTHQGPKVRIQAVGRQPLQRETLRVILFQNFQLVRRLAAFSNHTVRALPWSS